MKAKKVKIVCEETGSGFILKPTGNKEEQGTFCQLIGIAGDYIKGKKDFLLKVKVNYILLSLTFCTIRKQKH